MPTYQYACTNPEGKHEFEVVQSFTDAPVSECPECGAPVRKVYGSVGVVFKGSGFYRTDSRKAAASSESSSDGLVVLEASVAPRRRRRRRLLVVEHGAPRRPRPPAPPASAAKAGRLTRAVHSRRRPSTTSSLRRPA